MSRLRTINRKQAIVSSIMLKEHYVQGQICLKSTHLKIIFFFKTDQCLD
jgi:hypothetical protein